MAPIWKSILDQFEWILDQLWIQIGFKLDRQRDRYRDRDQPDSQSQPETEPDDSQRQSQTTATTTTLPPSPFLVPPRRAAAARRRGRERLLVLDLSNTGLTVLLDLITPRLTTLTQFGPSKLQSRRQLNSLGHLTTKVDDSYTLWAIQLSKMTTVIHFGASNHQS